MSVYGTITVECDNEHCHAELVLHVDALMETSVEDALWDDGWRNHDGLHICPQCCEEAQSRVKGDDDGREYGDPRDARDERF